MALRRAVKISAAVAADNFGWLGGTPSVFRRRRRQMIPAGGGTLRRLRGLNIRNNKNWDIALQTDRQTERHRAATDSRSMYIPECTFLTVKHFTLQLITLLIHPTNTQPTYSQHIANIQPTYSQPISQSVSAAYHASYPPYQHTTNIQPTCSQHTTNTQPTYNQRTANVQPTNQSVSQCSLSCFLSTLPTHSQHTTNIHTTNTQPTYSQHTTNVQPTNQSVSPS